MISDIKKLLKKAEAEKDTMLVVHFDKDKDRYAGYYTDSMDASDALIVIGELIKNFKLNPHVIAEMEAQ